MHNKTDMHGCMRNKAKYFPFRLIHGKLEINASQLLKFLCISGRLVNQLLHRNTACCNSEALQVLIAKATGALDHSFP